MSARHYLYCVGLSEGGGGDKEVLLVHGVKVQLLRFKDLTLVFRLLRPEENLLGEDVQTTETLVRMHQGVVEVAWDMFDAILPFSLGSVMTGGTQDIRVWMEQEHPRLVQKLSKVQNKAEYGIQVFWKPRQVVAQLMLENPTLKALRDQALMTQEGTAYLYRQSYEKKLKAAMEEKAQEQFRVIFEKIKACSSDCVIEKIKPAPEDLWMLLNVSTLADEVQAKALGSLLEDIKNKRSYYSVRFTGPWPPYSFVRS